MYIQSERIFEDQIRVIAHMFLITESGETIREARLMGDCLMQIKTDKSLNTNMIKSCQMR